MNRQTQEAATVTNAVLDALAPCWRAALVREQLDGTSQARADVWLRERRAPIPLEHLEIFERRSAGERAADIAREYGLPRARIQPILQLTGLRLIVPHLTQTPRWKAASKAGATYRLIAQAYDLPPHVVQVALEGWPEPLPHDPALMLDATKAWADGQSVAAVAKILQVTPQRLSADIRAGRAALGEPRWRPVDVRARLGWTSHVLSKRRREGAIPPPDGRDPSSWWWARTIEEHITVSGWTWCTLCPRAFIEPRGLTTHLTVMHPDLSEPTGR